MSRLARLQERLIPALPVVRAGAAIAWTVAELALVEARMRRRETAEQEAVFDVEMRRWCRGLLRVTGIRLHVSGSIPPTKGARLVVANHSTAVDIPIILSLFGGSVLSRGDVSDWPLLGYCARRAQTIFVDRDSRKSGILALRAIREQLQRGRTVCVFPEGTTTAGDELLPFSAGAFASTRKLDVEVVPVGIVYPPGTAYTEDSFAEHIRNVCSHSHLDVHVALGAPIRPEGKAQAIASEAQAAVQGLVAEARANSQR